MCVFVKEDVECVEGRSVSLREMTAITGGETGWCVWAVELDQVCLDECNMFKMSLTLKSGDLFELDIVGKGSIICKYVRQQYSHRTK